MTWFVYILKSKKDHGLYVGISQNPQKRLIQHNSGKTISTRNRKPFELCHSEASISLSEARQREIYLKSYNGADEKKKLANIGE